MDMDDLYTPFQMVIFNSHVRGYLPTFAVPLRGTGNPQWHRQSWQRTIRFRMVGSGYLPINQGGCCRCTDDFLQVEDLGSREYHLFLGWDGAKKREPNTFFLATSRAVLARSGSATRMTSMTDHKAPDPSFGVPTDCSFNFRRYQYQYLHQQLHESNMMIIHF